MSDFLFRHIGISEEELSEMLDTIGVQSIDELIDETVPESIRKHTELDLPPSLSEFEYLNHIRTIGNKNKLFKSLIGQGYYGTVTPSPILRNIFQNPGWYTQYTPYQAEISQGRLEALLNFQTMVSDLTGMPMANASLLDEATAAAEAMAMFYHLKNKKVKENFINKIVIADTVFASTIDVVRSRAYPIDIEVSIQDESSISLDEDVFAILLQYPNNLGSAEDFKDLCAKAKAQNIYIIVAADIMSLALLTPPGNWGADAVVGNTQRFGVPMGCGGPHAAYFATREEYKRIIPGRIIGVSIDVEENLAYRMALQTREQHIKREKATSNICTAQALLAIMAGMYAVYHGPKGIYRIAEKIYKLTATLSVNLRIAKFEILNETFFDTITVRLADEQIRNIKIKSKENKFNFNYENAGCVSISIDETCTFEDIDLICKCFDLDGINPSIIFNADIPDNLSRKTPFLTHPVFNSYHTESKLMRYIKRLENKDLSLVHSMIPLGSCTMKLNAASQLIPVSWPEFANIHPYAPINQMEGYQQVFDELEKYLCSITGFTACSLQPNSGAQGEFAGLMVIRAFHHAKNQSHRNIALIPQSAHGTNPASAVMAGYKVVVVACDDNGNIDINDLNSKCETHEENLATLMVTYPSTHGVFETAIMDICDKVHQHGGLVYMDGANMNAQVGLTDPGMIHADVCHLNLHKTFSIPHGGGGPGMGPICVNDKLAPYLPSNPIQSTGGSEPIPSISAAPWGSASILLISYGYIRLLGKIGVTEATKFAILNSNYIKCKLEKHYSILYTGEKGRTAHELIVDLRPYKEVGVSAEDVAKRLIDYGFHSPTLSFPVPGTIMIEPTESEDKDELDRFIEAMLMIHSEINEISNGKADSEDNVLHNAPHTVQSVTSDDWSHSYSRKKAAYPVHYLREGRKFWSAVARVNNGYGDRNLFCTCPPIDSYQESEEVT